jgi:hypothetical protein
VKLTLNIILHWAAQIFKFTIWNLIKFNSYADTSMQFYIFFCFSRFCCPLYYLYQYKAYLHWVWYSLSKCHISLFLKGNLNEISVFFPVKSVSFGILGPSFLQTLTKPYYKRSWGVFSVVGHLRIWVFSMHWSLEIGLLCKLQWSLGNRWLYDYLNMTISAEARIPGAKD